MNTITKLGARFSRDTLIFTGATAGTVLLAFATVAVVTRYLRPAEFGELAVLYVFAAFLTVGYNLPLLQGTLIRVFGSAGDEEAAADALPPSATDDAGVSKRSELTTGLLLTVGVALVGTAVAAAFAPFLSRLLLGTNGHQDSVVLAAGSAAVGAVWRLTSNVVRYEGRPWKYALLINARPVLVLGFVWLALAAGGGVREAVTGTFVGTILAVVLSLAVSARNYAFSFARAAVRPLAVAGLPYLPVIVAIWIVHNFDVFMLSWFSSDEEVGIYRLASRVASVGSYVVSALLIAWIPLSRSTIFHAARQEYGASWIGRLLVTYYSFLAVGLVLALAAGADALVQVAPPAYTQAAELIPLLGVAFVVYGFFLVVYRAGDFPHRRRRYIGMSVMAAAVFLISASVLIPRLGGYGAAAASTIAFASASVGILVYSESGAHPLRVEWRRIGAAIAIAGLLYVAARAVRQIELAPGIVVAIVVILLYPVLLVCLGLVRRAHLRPLLAIARSVLPMPANRRFLLQRLAELPTADRAALRLLLGHQEHDATTGRDAMRVLRQLSAVHPVGEYDAEIASYLLWRGSIPERDEKARELRTAGVDPLELHEMESTLAMLRRLPARVRRGLDVPHEMSSAS